MTEVWLENAGCCEAPSRPTVSTAPRVAERVHNRRDAPISIHWNIPGTQPRLLPIKKRLSVPSWLNRRGIHRNSLSIRTCGVDMKRAIFADPVAAATSKRMVATHSRDNERERSLRSELHRRGLRFRIYQRLLPPTRRTVDIAFPRARLAVFLDGCFWHGCPVHRSWPRNNAEWWRVKIESNIERDRDTDQRLQRLGWTVLRIWEHETIEVAVDRVVQTLGNTDAGEEQAPPAAR